jgi:hypothetical protein
LQRELGVERPAATPLGKPLPEELAQEIDALRDLEPDYRVWGDGDGRGLVIRSEQPVDFHPDGKIVNVVPVADLRDALRHVGVATQTVGVYPLPRKAALRDALAARGAQRVVTLGRAALQEPGLSHDGFFPLHRFVRWVNDED